MSVVLSTDLYTLGFSAILTNCLELTCLNYLHLNIELNSN